MLRYLQAEISASAVRENMKILRSCAALGTKLCPVVKCNCYGHGLGLLMPVFMEQADWLAVATPAEAIHVRRLKFLGPLLVLFSPCSQTIIQNRHAILDELIQRRVTLTVVSQNDVDELITEAGRVGQNVMVHVKIDTGMNRSGVPADLAAELIDRIVREPLVEMTGVYTHLATADEADKTFTHQQIKLFNETLTACNLPANVIRHAANSAGVLNHPESHFDMLRPGISVYGYRSSDVITDHPPLKPALRLMGHLMQIKTIPAGQKCGYGLTFECTRKTTLGLVPIGYGDGYFRCLSNKAQMRIGDKLVPVVGRVSMDQTIIDITDVPAAKLGDPVEIISNNPADPHSVENLARLAETIPYEITTRLGHRVRRKLVD